MHGSSERGSGFKKRFLYENYIISQMNVTKITQEIKRYRYTDYAEVNADWFYYLVNMVLNYLYFCETTLSSLLCDQFIMTCSSLDVKLFIQPFLPAEAAGGICFFRRLKWPLQTSPNHSDLLGLPNENILANYFFASCASSPDSKVSLEALNTSVKLNQINMNWLLY